MKNNYIKSERMWNVCLTYVYRMFYVISILFTIGTGQSWATKTIYFVNASNWGDPKCYAWNGSNTSDNNGWAGVAINVETGHQKGGKEIYKIELKDSYTMCIFSNNGSDKTGDLTMQVGKVYNNGTWTTYEESYWDPEFKSGQYIYINYSTSTWGGSSAKFRYNWNYNTSTYCCNNNETGRVSGENYAYAVTPNAYVRAIQILRYNSDYSTQWNYTGTVAVSSKTKNCITLTASVSNGYNFTWTTYAPPVTSIALSHNVTPISGDGSAGNPYLVTTGTSVTVTATPTNIGDPDITTSYKWDSGSYGNTNTKTLNCSVGGNTYSTTVTCRNAISGTNSTTKSATVYYQAVSTPTISLSAPSTAVRSNSITLTASYANATTPTIYYEYSTSSTFASSVTEINHTTSTTQSWTVPSGTSGTTYYLRAKMQVSSTWYYSDILTLTAYGKKTIKVKNTNNWGTMKLYLYSALAEKEDWPGSTTGITSAGGQWKTVVLTSEWPYFILNNDNNGSQIKGNKTYSYESSVTDGYCYVISEGTGDQLTLTYTANCPTAPTSITTSAATSLTNTTATINGSIGGNGNDNITDYGFYWGTSSTPGTKQAKGSSNYTGSISHGLTGLTAGTTYYYQAYATNGQGTTKSSPAASFVAPYKVTVSKTTGCTNITNSGVNYTSSTITVVATKTTGYTFSSWSTTNGTQTSTSSTSTTNTLTFTPSADLATIQPTYTENSYAVSVSVSPAATGSFSPTPSDGKITVKQVTGTNITANPATNYAFVSWTYSGGGLTSSSTTKTSNFKATGTGGSIQANFADKWNVKGSGTEMGSWSTYKGMPYAGSANTFRKTFSLPAKTTYSFKIVKRADAGGSDVWYGVNGGKTLTRAASSVTGLKSGTGEGDNITFTTDAAGTYTITYVYNASEGSMSVSVGYPTAYTVQFGSDGHGTVTATATSAGGSMTSGDYVASGDVVTFAQTPNTGYTLKGWYTTVDGSTSAGLNGSNQLTINAAKTVYAQYDAKTYNIMLNQQTDTAGYRASGSTSLTATYDAAFPSITTPTAQDGWAFMGYWSEARGKGTQFTDKDGALLADIENYSDASGHWKYDGTKTLYAYYKKAEITGITFSTAGVPGSVIAPSTSTMATATISPTPTGTTTICWRILHSNGNPLEEQPTFDPETGAAVSFTTSATSGSYLIEARLRLGSGCNGTVLDSVTSVFQVAGDHNVTVQYKDASGNTIKASEIVTGRPLAWSSAIEAPEIFGYTFDHWKAGDGITLSENGTSALGSDESDEETIYIKAVYDGRLTAVYNQNKFLYLDLSQQFSESGYWSDPWVYFYNGGNPWDASNGVGAQDNGSYHSYYKEAHAMTQIGTSKIWYFDYSDVSSSNRSQYIAFTWGRHDGQKNFNATDVIFRGDFNEGTPLFVPITGQTATTVSNTSAKYYNAGYWVKYLGQQTGYTLEIYNEAGNSLLKSIAFANEGKRMPMIATADLEAGKTYKYQLKRDDGIYYGNNSTMNNTNHGQTTPWAFTNDPSFPGMCGLQTTAAGEYTFHLTYSNNGGSFNLRIAVDYPIAQGDYRLLYKDNVHKLWHPSAVIPSVKAKDTVSFFVRTGKAANLKLQKCTGLGDGTVTWSDTVTWWNGSTLPSAITKDSVYNICLKHNATTGKLEIENVEGYSGNYYIRTDAANNKWDNYKAADHMMTYSEYSEHNSDFSHYWMAHVTATSSNKFNVKYVVANDYSPCISDTLIQSTYRGGDSYHVDASGFISVEANIRFMWKRSTNEVYRAYLAPAQSDGSKFLVLRGQTDDNLRDVDGNYLRDASNNNHLGGDYCMQFVDNENWIYETTVKVIPSSYVKLFALFNTKNFYYKGANNDTFNGSDSGDTYHTPNAIQLITGSGEAQLVRVIYDFKTDRLVAAYLPSGNITEDMDINADVMFIREHQGDIDQLTFNSGKKLTDVKTAYGVIRFNKWTLNNKEKTGSHTPLASPLSRYERDLFYISFPFRVNLNEVFGFGTYGVHWIIEYYDGAGRAEKGFWKDSPTFWKFVTNRNGFILEPNVGYLLALDLDQLGEESAVWNNRVENVELFFPSTGNIGSITSTSVTHNLPQHECTIIRPTPQGDRHIADSHWNIMSVPTYVNVNNPSFTSSTWTTTTLGPKFLYTWNSDDNTLTPTTAAGFNYHAMHAYTVQYYGNVTWTASTTSPIVARKLQEPSAYEWCLELQQNDKMIDRTYVRMSDEEEVTTGFEFGYDMSKSIEWAKANIYTFIGTEWVAGNSLPLETEQTTIIPVGLTLAAAGDYTFAMPAGTHGVGVTLVDTQTNERTNLSAGMTQTVTLTQGDHLDRFFLEISPIHNTPTDIGEVTGNGLPANGARKVLIDGILYIVKGDKLYDVRGTMIK